MSEAGYLLMLGLHYGDYRYPYSPVWAELTRLGYVKFDVDGYNRLITREGEAALKAWTPEKESNEGTP